MGIKAGYKMVAAYDEWGDLYHQAVPIETKSTRSVGKSQQNAYGEQMISHEEANRLLRGEPAKKKEEAKPVESHAAAAPAAGGSGGRSSGGGTGSGTGSQAVDQLFNKIDEMLGAKANEAIEGDPYGIAETKLNQLSPERVKRSFLTNAGDTGGEGGAYSYNMVVDPATGKAFQSASAAKAAGITNWVYKFQYDKKYQEQAAPTLIGEGATLNDASLAMAGSMWRNRYSGNRWYA